MALWFCLEVIPLKFPVNHHHPSSPPHLQKASSRSRHYAVFAFTAFHITSLNTRSGDAVFLTEIKCFTQFCTPAGIFVFSVRSTSAGTDWNASRSGYYWNSATWVPAAASCGSWAADRQFNGTLAWRLNTWYDPTKFLLQNHLPHRPWYGVHQHDQARSVHHLPQ